MKTFSICLSTLIVAVLCTIAFRSAKLNGAEPPAVPDRVAKLAGTYSGAWTAYRLGPDGSAIKQMSWTDTMRAENPKVEGGKAFVETTDEMVFEGGRIPPMKLPGKEGFFLKPDGSLGEYFIEANGQTQRVSEIDKGVCVYSSPVDARELPRLGADLTSGVHVMVKVITSEEGTEIHRITRITTVMAKVAGVEKSFQFISLQGLHKKQK